MIILRLLLIIVLTSVGSPIKIRVLGIRIPRVKVIEKTLLQSLPQCLTSSKGSLELSTASPDIVLGLFLDYLVHHCHHVRQIVLLDIGLFILLDLLIQSLDLLLELLVLIDNILLTLVKGS